MLNGWRISLLLGLGASLAPLNGANCQSSHMVAVPTQNSGAVETADKLSKPQSQDQSRQLISAIATGDADGLRHLLENGADANHADPRLGTTLLMMAQHPALIRLLLQHGADPSALDREGATALHYAVAGSRAMQIIPLLVNSGANVNACDDNGFSVLMRAVMNDKPELVGLMIHLGADLRLRTKDGQTALDWAQDLGFADIAELLEDASLKR